MKSKPLPSRCSAAFLAIAVAAVPLADARATTLARAMQKLAGGLKKELDHLDAKSVHVDMPDGPPGDGATARMRKELVDALRAQDVEIAIPLRADLKVAMTYSRSDGSNRYSMEVRVKNRSNQSLGVFNGNFVLQNEQVAFVSADKSTGDETLELTIDDPRERATIDGSNVDATLDAAGREQKATDLNVNEKLNARPRIVIGPGEPADGAPVDSVVSPQKGSKFRIEILARPRSKNPDVVGDLAGRDYQPRPVEDVDGIPLCELQQGDAYAVRVVNDADHAVAVNLSIDGINMWATSGVPEWRERGLFRVPARSSTLIRGWHFGTVDDPGLYREFTVVTLPESLAVDLGGNDESQIGQISAQFFASWLPDEEPPFVEAKGSQATKPGKPFRQQTKNVRAFVGQSLLAAISVRYVRPEPLDLP